MNINKSKTFRDFFTKSNIERKIDFLVLHHVEADSVDHAMAQFVEHKVSSHFLIDENGEVFSLVDENDIAYHAGISYWQGFEKLNQNSIGIEFINSAPFSKKFEPAQMQAGLELCRYLINKYNIAAQNIVGHSDIAYNSEDGLLDRKQDPSHLFDWKFFARAGVAIFPEISLLGEGDKKLFQLKNKAPEIKIIKEKLAQFGYKVKNQNDEFDLEMQALARVFNRRFNPAKFESDADSWYLSSQMILDKLTSFYPK